MGVRKAEDACVRLCADAITSAAVDLEALDA